MEPTPRTSRNPFQFGISLFIFHLQTLGPDFHPEIHWLFPWDPLSGPPSPQQHKHNPPWNPNIPQNPNIPHSPPPPRAWLGWDFGWISRDFFPEDPDGKYAIICLQDAPGRALFKHNVHRIVLYSAPPEFFCGGKRFSYVSMGHWECLESFLRPGNKFFYLKEKKKQTNPWDVSVIWGFSGFFFPNIFHIFQVLWGLFFVALRCCVSKMTFFLWKSGKRWIFPPN